MNAAKSRFTIPRCQNKNTTAVNVKELGETVEIPVEQVLFEIFVRIYENQGVVIQ